MHDLGASTRGQTNPPLTVARPPPTLYVQVALHELTEPVFGPAFMHLRAPAMAHFVGAASPKDDAGHYLRCVFSLFDGYMQ